MALIDCDHEFISNANTFQSYNLSIYHSTRQHNIFSRPLILWHCLAGHQHPICGAPIQSTTKKNEINNNPVLKQVFISMVSIALIHPSMTLSAFKRSIRRWWWSNIFHTRWAVPIQWIKRKLSVLSRWNWVVDRKVDGCRWFADEARHVSDATDNQKPAA